MSVTVTPSPADAVMRAFKRGASRAAVIALLAEFGAKRTPELKISDVGSFVRRCDSLQEPLPPLPLPQAPAKFAIGERVRGCRTRSGYNGYGAAVEGTVAGYEVRYVIQRKDGVVESFARRAEYLAAAPPIVIAPPADHPTDWAIGSAIDDAKRQGFGASFTRDGQTLRETLAAHGLMIVPEVATAADDF